MSSERFDHWVPNRGDSLEMWGEYIVGASVNSDAATKMTDSPEQSAIKP